MDGQPPAVRISRAGGRVVIVRVRDRGSGLVARLGAGPFGDGAHRLAPRACLATATRTPGTYPVYVTARDKPATAVTAQAEGEGQRESRRQ